MGCSLARNHRHQQQQQEQAPQHYCHRSLFFFLIVAYLLLGYTPTNATTPVTTPVVFTSTSATAAAAVIVEQHDKTLFDKFKDQFNRILHTSDGPTNNLTDVTTNATSNHTSLLLSMFGIDPVNMTDIGSIFSATLRAFAQALMIFGGIVPYIPQYLIIKRSQNAEGFSNYVCLTLLVANIVRIEFWFGKHFETPLLLQSIVMIICMLVMLELWTRVHSRSMRHHLPVNQQVISGISGSKEQLTESSEKRFTDFQVDFFWRWTTFASYIQFLCVFTFILSIITWFLLNNSVYIETIGFLAVFFEALLGTPQFMRNFRLKSTEGMSVKMVLMWASGDIFKTVYFILRKAPKQFWLCGSLQIAIDFAILCQVIVYSDKFRGRKR